MLKVSMQPTEMSSTTMASRHLDMRVLLAGSYGGIRLGFANISSPPAAGSIDLH
jgi:hypothetical protein